MKIATFSVANGAPRVGVVSGEEISDIGDSVPDMLTLVQGGAAALEQAKSAAQKAKRYKLSEVRLLAPFPRPPKNILCTGLNYKAHIAEGIKAGTRTTDDAPPYPIWFTKAVTSVCGPFDDIQIEP